MSEKDTPVDFTLDLDIIAPYSIRLGTKSDSSYMTITEGQRQNGVTWKHTLKPGCYLVQMDYTGPESAEIWMWAGDDTATRVGGVDSAGGANPRSGRPLPVQSDGTLNLAVVQTPRPNASRNPASASSTAALRIIPMDEYKPETS